MSQQIVVFLINKFVNALKDGSESKFPYKGMLSKIKDDLEQVGHGISHNQSTIPIDISNKLLQFLYSLDEILRECRTLSKKRLERGEIFMKWYSPAELLLLHKFKERLQKIKQALNSIRTEIHSVSIPIPPTQSQDPTRSMDQKKKTLQWTSSTINASKIYGWDKEVEEINMELLKETNGLNTVGIIGMFGTGKSSLAQKIFVSKEVLDKFPLRLWVWVSAECKEEELVRRMLDNLRVEEEEIKSKLKNNPNKAQLGVLLFILYLQLLNKRYLIVFDDMQNLNGWYSDLQAQPPEDREWDHLAHGLPKGNGSAIIITGRKEDDVWKMVGNGKIYTPKPLIGDDGWALFQCAFKEEGKTSSDVILDRWKQEIMIMCGGLPKALITAGKRMAGLMEKNGAERVLQLKSSGDKKPNDENPICDGVQAEKQKAEDAIAEEGSSNAVRNPNQAENVSGHAG